ncbi:MAG: coiled-coil domain-containing protein [Promethearchaeota archaeon]
MPYYIAFDNSHKERARLDENFTELRDYLNENDFICYNFLETPVTQESLNPFDILVIACPDFSKFSHIELMEIVNWVKEEGGGLLLLSHAGGDRGRNSNLSELSEQFGIAFENDQVLDEVNNIGIENMPIISSINFIPPHPITNGVSSICYRAGCSLTVIGSAISIATSNETSEPFSCPLICTSEPNRGRVCAIGSYEMFRDKTGGGFQYDDHENLSLNIFNWLISDYRMEFTKQGEEHTLPVSIKPVQTIEDISTSVKPVAQVATQITAEAPIKFSSKAEVIEILNNYRNQINAIKTSINKLIDIISESAEEIFCEPEVQNIQKVSPTNPDFIYEPYEEDEEVKRDYFGMQNTSDLTALPPRPPELLKKEVQANEDSFIKPVPTPPSNISGPSKPPKESIKNQKKTKTPKKKTTPKGEKKEENKDELKAELDSLESKLNSVLNLIEFIEKKHEDGKLDDKTYEKQIQKLQKDLDQTKKRISEIKKLLD